MSANGRNASNKMATNGAVSAVKNEGIFDRTLALLLCGYWGWFCIFFVFSEILPNTKCGKGNKGKSGNLFFHKNPV